MTRSVLLLAMLLTAGPACIASAADQSAAAHAGSALAHGTATAARADHVAHAHGRAAHHHRAAAGHAALHAQFVTRTHAGTPIPARPAQAPRHTHSALPGHSHLRRHVPQRDSHAGYDLASSDPARPAPGHSPSVLDHIMRPADRWMTPTSGRGPPPPSRTDALRLFRADRHTTSSAARRTLPTPAHALAAASPVRLDRARRVVPHHDLPYKPEPIPGSPAHRPEGAVACIVMPSNQGVPS